MDCLVGGRIVMSRMYKMLLGLTLVALLAGTVIVVCDFSERVTEKKIVRWQGLR